MPWKGCSTPNVWPVLGAIGERTESIGIAVGVTCPTVRIHPAILAHLNRVLLAAEADRVAALRSFEEPAWELTVVLSDAPESITGAAYLLPK